MPGHISLPDYQGYADRPVDAPPATLDAKLLNDLLRTELGFDGLIISDATGMIGLTSRVCGPTERVSAVIKAGCDVYLFPEPERDYAYLLEAVKRGQLPKAGCEAARRGWS